MSLDGLLNSHKQSLDKSGVGHEEGQCSKSTKVERQKFDANNIRDSISKNRNSAFKRFPTAEHIHMGRFNHSYFYGYFFTCNYFGHKAINCRVFSRRNLGFVNRNSFAPLRNYNVICYKCNKFGHIAKVCQSGMADFSKRDDAKDSTKVWRKKEKQST